MTHSPSVQSRHDELVAQGREALLQGDKTRAQALLNEAVALDAHSEEAWMWLSGTYTAPADMAACLQRVRAINPNNEQAIEGLRWIEAKHNNALVDPQQPLPPIPDAPTAVHFHPQAEAHQSIGALIEAALHPLAAGALLGLLRLVSWLRPTTLAQMRSEGGPVGATGSLGIVLATVLLHGIAMLVVWVVVSNQFSRVRVMGRGDRFDSLVQVGQIWVPGYLWGAALAVAALGLGLNPQLWRVIAGLCWLLLLAGALLIVRRLWQLLAGVAVPRNHRVTVGARLMFMALLGVIVGLGLAGIVTAALLG